MSQEAGPRARRVSGMLLVVGSAGMAWLVHAHPEKLRAPAWVAYAAILSFGVAGLLLVAQATGNRLLKALLPPLLITCMLAPAVWIVFGAPDPSCGMRFLGYFGIAPASACRVGFGLGGLVMLAILAVALRQSWRSLRSSQ